MLLESHMAGKSARRFRGRVAAAFFAFCVAGGLAYAGGGREHEPAPEPATEQNSADVPTDAEALWNFTPDYLELFQGLHVTGTRKDVDIESYRLNVVGKVQRPLDLTFDEIKQMTAQDREVLLVCPGFFEDNGVWRGVPLAALLEKAGPLEDASSVRFEELDGTYFSRLPLDRALGEGMLISYQFNGQEFHPSHGFPLRLVAEGEQGNVWVKWLGTIRVE